MPNVIPDDNEADSGYSLPDGWFELDDPRVRDNHDWHYPTSLELTVLPIHTDTETAPPPPHQHGDVVCVVCGGDSWCDADHGRVVVAHVVYMTRDIFSERHGRMRPVTRDWHAVPVHLQCVAYCEGHSNYCSHDFFDDPDCDSYCGDCEENRTSCEYNRCDVRTWSDDMNWHEGTDSYYCDYHYREVCEDEDEDDDYDYDSRRRSSVIHSYSHRPIPVFRLVESAEVVTHHGRLPNAVAQSPTLGWELETNFRGEYHEQSSMCEAGARALLAAHPTDYLYCKEDGSISGFEIVSHPATVEAHRLLLKPEVLRQLATEFKQSSWTSVNGTGAGLHVHIAKASFPKPSHVQRFQMFHYKNEEMIKKFAGRDSRRWASFEKPDVGLSACSRGGRQHNRYVALNFWNEKTIELRYFRGSLDANTVLGVLEFVHSMWRYTQVISSKEVADGGTEWNRYRNWLDDEYDTLGFQHLRPLLAKRGV